MARRSTVGRTPDTALLGRAVSFPGIDPRTWVSYGIVTAYALDAAEGPFVDVTLMPSRIQETARVGDSWASGDGVVIPFDNGDEVLVGYPDGDVSYGLVVLKRMYSPSDLPPQLAVDEPEAIVVNSKRKVIVQLHDGAELIVQSVKDGSETADPGKITVIGKDILVTADNIKLGGDLLTYKVARKDDSVAVTLDFNTVSAITAAQAVIAAWIGAGSPLPKPIISIPATGSITSGSDVVYAK